MQAKALIIKNSSELESSLTNYLQDVEQYLPKSLAFAPYYMQNVANYMKDLGYNYVARHIENAKKSMQQWTDDPEFYINVNAERRISDHLFLDHNHLFLEDLTFSGNRSAEGASNERE
jgi:hypothetical protein